MKLALALLLIIMIPTVAAEITAGDVIGDGFGLIGELIQGIVNDEQAFLGLIFILMTLIFKAVIESAFKRTGLFAGMGGAGVSKSGKLLVWSVALLLSVSFTFLGGALGFSNFLRGMFGAGNPLGAMILMGLLFLLLWKRTGLKARGALFWAGVIALISSGYTGGTIGFLGLMMIIISLISRIGGFGKIGKVTTRSAEKDAVKAQEGLSEELGKEKTTERHDENLLKGVEHGEELESNILERLANLINRKSGLLQGIFEDLKGPYGRQYTDEAKRLTEEEIGLIKDEEGIEKVILKKLGKVEKHIKKHKKKIKKDEEDLKEDLKNLPEEQIKGLEKEFRAFYKLLEEYEKYGELIENIKKHTIGKNKEYSEALKKEMKILSKLQSEKTAEATAHLAELQELAKQKIEILSMRKQAVEASEHLEKNAETTIPEIEKMIKRVKNYINNKELPEEEGFAHDTDLA